MTLQTPVEGMGQRCFLGREATSGHLHLKTLDGGIGDAPQSARYAGRASGVRRESHFVII